MCWFKTDELCKAISEINRLKSELHESNMELEWYKVNFSKYVPTVYDDIYTQMKKCKKLDELKNGD